MCVWFWQAVVLDQGLEDDLVADIQKHLEELFDSGIRQRLITLIKVRSFSMRLFSSFLGLPRVCLPKNKNSWFEQRQLLIVTSSQALIHLLHLS